MSSYKTSVVILCSFIAAAIVCIAAGLAIYFTAVNLPAEAVGRGTRVLIGMVVLAVGAVNCTVSCTVLAAVLIKNFYISKKQK